MAVIDLGLVPSLLQGISQQPQGLRLPGQAQEVFNGWGTVVEGMTKRLPTRHVAKVSTGTLPPGSSPKFHAINRDPEERYLVAVYPDRILAYETDGTPVHVEMTASVDYLSTRTQNPIKDPETMLPIGPSEAWSEIVPGDTETPAITAELGPLGWGLATNCATTAGSAAVGRYNHSESVDPFFTDRMQGGIGAITVLSCWFKRPLTDPTDSVQLKIRDLTGLNDWLCDFDFTGQVLAPGTIAVAGAGGDATVGELQSWVESIGNDWYRACVQLDAATDYSVRAMATELVVNDFNAAARNLLMWGYHIEYLADDRATSSTAAPYVVREEERIKLLTVQDHTFIANNSIEVAKAAGVSASPEDTGSGWVFVRTAPQNVSFQVEASEDSGAHVDEIWQGTFTTLAGSGNSDRMCTGVAEFKQSTCTAEGGTWGAADSACGPDPKAVAKRLTDKFNALPAPATGPEYIATQHGAVVHFTSTDVIDYINSEASSGHELIISFLGAETEHAVDRISSLPLVCEHGYRVRIDQGSEDSVDDVFVEFVADAGSGVGDGRWVESTPYAQANTLDATTMPHVLVRKQDNASGTVTGTAYAIYFEFEVADWSDREVGDDDSNPDPAFVGQAVNNLTFYRNRLGFISGQDATFSGTGDYFNFWRTTTLTLLDSDTVGTQVTHTSVSTLYNSMPFDRNLVLFSDRGQFVLTGEPVLSPTTINTKSLYSYESLTVPGPAEEGKTIAWFTKQGNFSTVRELRPSQRATDVYDVDDITEQVPKLISGLVVQSAASTLADTLVVLSDGDRSKLYAYTWFYRQDTKLQSAWVEWDFANGPTAAETTTILGIEFIEDELFMLVERDDGVYIEAMQISEGLEDSTEMAFVARLDRRVPQGYPGVTMVYNSGPDTTTISGLPWDLPDGASVGLMGTNRNPGFVYTLDSEVTSTPGAHTVTFGGDLTAEEFYLGFNYTFRYQFSEAWRSQPTSRGSIAPSLREPYQVVAGALLIEDSGSFDVQIQPKNGALVTQEFRGTIEGIPTRTIVGSGSSFDVNLASGIYRFAIGAKNNEHAVTVASNSPLPVRMVNAEWETEYEPRGG